MTMLEVFFYPFFQRAILVGTLIAIIGPTIGIFILNKRFSSLTDSLGHISLLGVSLGFIFKFFPSLTATLATIIAGILIEFIRQTQKQFNEAILVLFTSFGLAAALILAKLAPNSGFSLEAFLFGNINTLTNNDLYLTITVFGLVMLMLGLLYNRFFALTLDEDITSSMGLRSKRLNYILISMASLVVAICLQIVGVLLISSLMIIPVLSSLLLSLNFRLTNLWAIIFAVASVWIGMIASLYSNTPTGATIALTSTLLYFIILCCAKLKNAFLKIA